MRHTQRLTTIAAMALCLTSFAAPAPAQTMRVAMTAADLPTTSGIPNNGGEGYRFLGFTAFDSLVNWDFSHPDRISMPTPGLATEWKVDDANHLRWIFTLRDGVRFHDGTPLTADAVMWNLGRLFDDKAPQYDPSASAIVRSFVNMLDRFEKIDDKHIAIFTKYPFSFFPAMATYMLVVSPTAWEKAGKSWVEFAKAPAGTGPFKITKVVTGQYAELSRNEDYWDKARVPKLAKMIVQPMPEATTRLAALRAGQVDWIEVPPPDAIPSLKAAGFQISLWPYPHSWPYVLNTTDASVFKDKRIRQALNYAIDRDSVVKFLNGAAKPAAGLYPVDNPLFGKPQEHYKFDPEKATALLKEAGYGPDKPVKAKIMISTAGSGQMLPLPMNEIIQQQAKPLGFDLQFDVVEWGAMIIAKRNAPDAPQSHGDDALNNSLGFADPSVMARYYSKNSFAPTGTNWGKYTNPKLQDLLNKAQESFDPEQQAELIAQAHAIVVDDAAWAFIVHDLNPRAMSAKVKGFQPAQSWYQDFTKVTMQ